MTFSNSDTGSSQTDVGQKEKNALCQIRLVVRGLGHVPAIKNSMFSIVDPKNREWKRRCVQSFVSQLLSSIPTSEQETPMPHFLRCLIASLPHDDNWKVVSEIQIQCQEVPPGDEGAEITIYRL